MSAILPLATVKATTGRSLAAERTVKSAKYRKTGSAATPGRRQFQCKVTVWRNSQRHPCSRKAALTWWAARNLSSCPRALEWRCSVLGEYIVSATVLCCGRRNGEAAACDRSRRPKAARRFNGGPGPWEGARRPGMPAKCSCLPVAVSFFQA